MVGWRRWDEMPWIDRFAVYVAVVTALALVALFIAAGCTSERPAELEPLLPVTTTTTP